MVAPSSLAGRPPVRRNSFRRPPPAKAARHNTESREQPPTAPQARGS